MKKPRKMKDKEATLVENMFVEHTSCTPEQRESLAEDLRKCPVMYEILLKGYLSATTSYGGCPLCDDPNFWWRKSSERELKFWQERLKDA